MDKKMILIAEDDPRVGESLRQWLKKKGNEILLASNGKEALQLFRHGAIDLVITDVVMPKMDGHALIRTIRNAGGESDLAIVAVSGALEGGVEKRLERDGADAVLDKALGAELIAQAADAVLERRRMRNG